MKKQEVAGRMHLGWAALVGALVALLSLLLWWSNAGTNRQSVSPENESAPATSEPEVVVESIRRDAVASLAEEELPEGSVEEEDEVVEEAAAPAPWVLRGRVVDSAGLGVENMMVQTRDLTTGVEMVQWNARTDQHGRFDVSDCPAGSAVDVSAFYNGAAVARRVVTQADASTEIQLVVPIDLPRGSVAGRLVRPDGEPVDSATVGVSGQGSPQGRAYEHQSADGRFTIEDLVPGEYQLGFRGAFVREYRNVSVRSGEETSLGDVQLQDGGRVCVLVPDDAPSGWEVHIVSRDGGRPGRMDADRSCAGRIPSGQHFAVLLGQKVASVALDVSVVEGGETTVHFDPEPGIEQSMEIHGEGNGMGMLSVRSENGHLCTYGALPLAGGKALWEGCLAAGAYTAELTYDSMVYRESFTVTEGQDETWIWQLGS